MSKWKEKTIQIIQIISWINDYYKQIGLGSDGKLYQWDYTEGAWEKFWNDKDKPS
ncbi:MAG TPA: hypothetical protein VNG32_00470 [Candidatus Dormibacteraeota bacterium]|nr:hypothetical protein [Candidatus Dormibacteraeota bacterium]